MNEAIQQKRLAIFESVVNTATAVSGFAKQLPNTGKRRNIFVKSYNRRPNNKRKRALLLAQIAWSAHMGAVQIAIVASQPILKYVKEGVYE